MKFFIISMILFLHAGYVNGFEITETQYTINLTGKIEKGDFNKLLSHLRKGDNFPNYFTITSGGGDVLEATEIGTFIRETATGVVVSDYCNSACFFILVAGVYRTTNSDSQIGLHRPYYNKEYFSGLSLSQAEAKYRELQTRSRNYLQAMGVPNTIIETMFSIPSDDVHIMNESEQHFLSQSAFAYSEWVRSKCDLLSVEESKDYNPFGQFDENPSKKYSSIGYFNYLKAKYNKAEECKNELKKKSREKALEKYN